MAFAVSRPNGRWELRESRATPAGPRSRTLASFRILTPEVAEQACSRSQSGLTPAAARRAAERAGAPVAADPVTEATAKLIRSISHGRQPTPAHRRLLIDTLDPVHDRTTDAERAAAQWLGVGAQERGETLLDLLLLADALPSWRGPELRFPRLRSTP